MTWPQSIAFNDLMTAAQTHLNSNQLQHNAPTEAAKQKLAQALLQAHLAGCVEIHAHKAPFVTAVSERPVASALARLQLRTTLSVSTVRHEVLRIDDSLARQVLLLLDGTRDRGALLKEVGDGLDGSINSLARHALLVA
jgi:hypothetical protein